MGHGTGEPEADAFRPVRHTADRCKPTVVTHHFLIFPRMIRMLENGYSLPSRDLRSDLIQFSGVIYPLDLVLI